MKLFYFLFLFLFLFLVQCQGGDRVQKDDKTQAIEEPKENIPSPDELIGEADPIAVPNAVKGGSIITWGASFPKSLNYWTTGTTFTFEVISLLFEPLLNMHSTEDRPVGILAESWNVSHDQRVYRFTLRKEAKWSDGTPITTADIQFYYDTIMKPEHLTPVHKTYLRRFERPRIIDERTLEIVAKKTHWKNFWYAGSFMAFPKHLWAEKDFNKQQFDFPIVSGPYRISEIRKERYLVLKRRPDWWGQILAYNQYKYNIDRIRYRFITDRNKALEAFKRGDLDIYGIYTASIWMKQTHFEAVKKGWVLREKVYNRQPMGFQGLAFNLRKKQFQDIRVRRALAYLLDREAMNEKFMYNQYLLINSFFADLYPQNINPEIEVIRYQPEKARKLLRQAGWRVNGVGKLVKDEQPFKITFITASDERRHLDFYCQALKKVGIDAQVDGKIQYSTFQKRIDDRKFDMVWMAWSSSRLRDPESLWHSNEADKKSSYNITGFKHSDVDAIIERHRKEIDPEKRKTMLRKIDAILAREIPYVFLWNSDHHRLLSWRRFGRPRYVLDKYNALPSITTYWWVDPKKKKHLEESMRENKHLSVHDEKIHYGQ